MEWSQIGDPVEGTDFAVFFTDPLNPDIELTKGDGGWVVSSELVSTGAPANIGAITTPDDDNYVVKIAKGSGPGAASVGSMVLQPAGDHYSAIADGSRITGDLIGDLVLQATIAGSRGELTSLVIGGDATGNITIPKIMSLSIGGDMSGTINADVVTVSLVTSDLSGDIVLVDGLFGANLRVARTFVSTGSIVIADMASIGSNGSSLNFNDVGQTGDFDFAGDLTLLSGLKLDQSVFITGLLTDTGSIDFNGQDLVGLFELNGGGSGDIVNVGAVTGRIFLAGGETQTFSGTATFASVAPFGWVRTELADMSGIVTVTGNMSGFFAVGPGDLLSGGRMSVGGDVDGQIGVFGIPGFGGDVMPGARIDIGGQLLSNGEVAVYGFMSGAIDVGADLNGEIVIGGSAIGGALTSSGSITINAACDVGNANGNITIGPHPQSLDPFKDRSRSSGFRALPAAGI